MTLRSAIKQINKITNKIIEDKGYYYINDRYMTENKPLFYPIENNHVMVARFGKKWKLSIAEHRLSCLISQHNIDRSSNHKDLILFMFDRILKDNPQLKIFSHLPEDQKFDIVWGTASRLNLDDMMYYVTVNHNHRQSWVTNLANSVRLLYNEFFTPYKENRDGYLESLYFILSPLTVQKILDYCERQFPNSTKNIKNEQDSVRMFSKS